jgi:hypothetical protein
MVVTTHMLEDTIKGQAREQSARPPNIPDAGPVIFIFTLSLVTAFIATLPFY